MSDRRTAVRCRFPSLGINFISASYRSRCSSPAQPAMAPSGAGPVCDAGNPGQCRGPAARRHAASHATDRTGTTTVPGISNAPAGSALQADPLRGAAGAAACRPGALRLHRRRRSPAPTVLRHSSPGAPPALAGVPTTSAPLETTQSSNKAPVYWIGRSNSNVFLYREFRDVPGTGKPGDPGAAGHDVARSRWIRTSSPRGRTPRNWPRRFRARTSSRWTCPRTPSTATSTPTWPSRAIQQLVYTATAAGASSGLIDAGQQIQVVILVDGHTDYVAFNHVRLGTPMSRSRRAWWPRSGSSIRRKDVEVADGSVKITGRSTASRRQAALADPAGRRATATRPPT